MEDKELIWKISNLDQQSYYLICNDNMYSRYIDIYYNNKDDCWCINQHSHDRNIFHGFFYRYRNIKFKSKYDIIKFCTMKLNKILTLLSDGIQRRYYMYDANSNKENTCTIFTKQYFPINE